jgi:hypothetical protein
MSQSPEEVALALLHMVAAIENKRISPEGTGGAASRNWLFSTYRQCLKTVTKPLPADPVLGARSADAEGQTE